MNRITLEKQQLRAALINLICIKLLFVYPKKIVEVSGSAAWIQMIYVSLISIIIYLITFAIYQKIGIKSVLELSEKLGGRVLKTVVGVLSALIFSTSVLVTIRSFPEVVKMVLLPQTPMAVVLLVFGAAIYIGCICGIGSLMKIHEIFMPIAVIVILIFLAFLIPEMKITNIYPVFGTGITKILGNGIESVDIYIDIFALNFFLPYCKDINDAKKAGFQAITLSAVFAVLFCFIYAAIYPYPIMDKFLFPFYQLARMIHIGDFFQRLEVFFEFVWSISILLYSSLYIYLICNILKDSFNLKYHKPIIIPVLSIILVIIFITGDMRKNVYNYRWIQITVSALSYMLPIILGTGYLLRQRRDRKNEKN